MEDTPLPEQLYQSGEWKALAQKFDHDKQAVAAVFAEASSVESVLFVSEAWQLEPVGSWGELGGHGALAYHAMGPLLDRAFAARLGALVLDARSYHSPGYGEKLCDFMPTVGFRVRGVREWVDVIVCFGCLQLMVLENISRLPLRSMGGVRGRFRVAGDFDPVAGSLARLALEALPGLAQWEHGRRRGLGIG